MLAIDFWSYIAVALTVFVYINGQEYTITAPGGVTCPTCNLTLADVVSDPQKYFTSNARLTFLPGTHILDHDGPVVISDVSNLMLQGTGELEDGFHWTVKQSKAFIKCSNSTGGFVFNRSSVHIILLTFTDCGLPIDSTYQYLKKRYAPFQNGLYSSAYNFEDYSELWSTLYFVDSPFISLNQMSVQNCSGSCLYFLNTLTIHMNHVYVAHSSPESLSECCTTSPSIINNERRCAGGNVIFFYLSSPTCINELDAFVTIFNSSFSFGAGPIRSAGAIMAGMTFVNLRSINLIGHFQSIVFYGNTGGNFGTLTIMSFFNFINMSSLRSNMYQCPSTPLYIAFKVSITNELLCPINSEFVGSSVSINDSYLAENTAIDSAGVNIDTSYIVSFLQQASFFINFNISNTQIVRNRASLASCIGSGGISLYQGFASFFLNNVTMAGNVGYDLNESPYIGIPPSCIVLYNTIRAYFIDVVIADHDLVGIVSISSNLYFQGDILIANNTGTNGGGLLLQEFSNVILQPNTTVNFIDNRAEFGAGIYISEQDIRAYIYQNSQLCLYQVMGNPNTSNSYFYFLGNEASITGNAVYGGFLSNCLLFFDLATSPSDEFTSKLFKINSSSSEPLLTDISSIALRLCFCENDYPQCNVSVYNASSVFPGQTVEVSIVPVGQHDGLTVGQMNISFHFKNYSYSDMLTNTNASCMVVPLPVQLFEAKNVSEFDDLLSNGLEVNFTIRLESRSDLFETIPYLSVNVPVNQCPPGFAINSSFICQCQSIFLKESEDLVSCNISNDTISHDGNIWIGYDDDNGVLLGTECPFDYCVHRPVTFNILDSPDRQCAYHRSGILCGGCADGYSLLLGSNECGKCPNNNYLSLLLVFGVAGIALVVLLILLNLTVSVGTINGIIFYANIVQINESIFFPNGRIPVLSNFISFLNLDFGIRTCFYSGMTQYGKIWLQYVFPAYIWVIILVIIILSRYSVKLSKLVSSNAVPVLATLVLLTYTKLIRTYSSVFKIAYVKTEDGMLDNRWAVDGNLYIFAAKHNFLLIFSLAVFFFVVLPFTIFVIIVPLFEKHLSTKCGRLWLQFLKPVSDAYSGPFTDTRRYWVGFGLIARVIVAISVPLLSDQHSLMVIFFVALFLLSLFTLFGGYYKLKYLNYLEVWTNLNLITITVLALGDAALVGTYLTVILMILTFIGIVIFHIVQRITRRKFCLSKPLKSRVSDDDASLGSFAAVREDTYKNNRVTSGSIDTVDYEKYDSRFRESLMEYISQD